MEHSILQLPPRFCALLIAITASGCCIAGCGSGTTPNYSTPTPYPTTIPVSQTEQVSLPIPKTAQLTSEWCWAACAQMAIQYVTGIQLDQRQLVETAKGLPPGSCYNYNQACVVPGTLTDIQNLISYYGGQPSTTSGPLDPQSLYNVLSGNHPVIAFLNTSPTVGHFVVVTSISITPDGQVTIVVNDPFFTYVGAIPYSTLASVWAASIIVY